MRNWNILGIILAVLTTSFPVYSQTPKTVGQLDTQNDVIRNETVPGANTRTRIADMNKSIYLSSPNLFGTYAYPQSWLTGYQSTLVSGTDIKTINGSSLLGSGNIVISSGITNSAGNTFFMMSDGTNAISSGFSYSSGFLNPAATDLKINGRLSAGPFSITPLRRLESEENSSGANDVLYPLRISSVASVTPGVGKGVGMEYQTEVRNSVYKVGATIESVFNNVTSTTEAANTNFYSMTAGALVKKMAITTDGNQGLDVYENNGSLLGSIQNGGTFKMFSPTAQVNLSPTSVSSTTTGTFQLGSNGTDLKIINPNFILLTKGSPTVSPDRFVHIETDESATNTVTYQQRLTVTSSGTPANGIGVGKEFEVETTASNNEIIATIEAVVVDNTSTAEKGRLDLKTMVGGAAATTSLSVSSDGISTNGTQFVKFITGSATLDFPNTTASNSNDLTITVTGAIIGEVCTCTPPNGSVVANSIYTCWVSASNTVTVRFSNLDILNAANPASNTFKAIVFKF